MLTQLQIIQLAARITINNKVLWVFGIFLSSGFNLHAWYAWQWFTQSGLADRLRFQIMLLGEYPMWLVLIGGLAIAFVIINFLKLMFLCLVHNQVHDLGKVECLLCGGLKDTQVYQYLIQRKYIWIQTVLLSVFTAVVTGFVVSVFHFYSTHTDYNFAKAILMILSLLLVLVGISWWNLLTVLNILWHQQPLGRAVVLALDMISARIGSMSKITLLATMGFLVSIAAGGTIFWQLPNLLASSPNYLFSTEIFPAWRLSVSLLSGALFLFWLVINNVWFNIVMVIWFGEQVKSKKGGQESYSEVLNKNPLPSPLHHSMDKGQEI